MTEMTAETATILIVEDDTSANATLRDVLTLDGFHTVGVTDPNRATDLAATVQPDVFVIDLMLPGQSGIELAAELRDLGFERTPMIGISGSPLLCDLAIETALFQCVLLKPFDLDELCDKIVECVEEAQDSP